MQALDVLQTQTLGDVRLAARATLASHRDHFALIDAVLLDTPAQFETGTEVEATAPQLSTGADAARPGSTAPRSSTLDEAGSTIVAEDGAEALEGLKAVYSPEERLQAKDFSLFSPEERKEADRFIRTLRWGVLTRKSRRKRPGRHGEIDMRRLLRSSVRSGGEILKLHHRGPKPKHRRLVLLCDISGSMDSYTRMLLQFLYRLESSLNQVEVFVFGTRLTRITGTMRNNDVDAAIAAVSSQVIDWSGGTRIGDAIGTFNRSWARRVAGNGAVIMIISDGWDRGSPEILSAEMARLQRLSHRLIWLNPLLGLQSYEPLTQGLQAALPFVDDFLPMNSLSTLVSLASHLNAIGPQRPARRHAPFRANESNRALSTL